MAAELKTVTRCCISACSYSKTLRTNAPEGGQRQHCILSHSWFLHITTGAVPWDELSKLNSHHDTGRDQLEGGHVVPCPPRDRGDKVGAGYEHKPLEST